MTKNELQTRYFDWVCQLVDNSQDHKNLPYRKLLTHLHNIDFYYILDMDGNRFEDGVNLRYRFGFENGYEGPIIASYLDNKPCSVLEMMVALSIRCEEDIMGDPCYGNRLSRWFWGMVSNLDLMSMTDLYFDESYVNDVIERLLERKYKKNGDGGLFTINRHNCDMRTVEIWYQMCWYLDSIIN